MDNTIYTIDTVRGDQIYQRTKTNRKSRESVWDSFRQLVGTIGEFLIEVIRSHNAPEPDFSNGSPRVLIRPDRIDLV